MTTKDESYWYFKNVSHYSYWKCSEMFRKSRWKLVIRIQRIKLATKIMTADVTLPRLWICILSDFFKLTATCQDVSEFLLNQIIGDSIQVLKKELTLPLVNVVHKMCHWDISHESHAVDSKEMYQKVWLLYNCRLNMFLSWASIQTSLIPNFLCFLALIIHKRQRFTLRTDSNYNMTAIHSCGFAHWTFYSFVGVVAIVVIVAQTPFVYRLP